MCPNKIKQIVKRKEPAINKSVFLIEVSFVLLTLIVPSILYDRSMKSVKKATILGKNRYKMFSIEIEPDWKIINVVTSPVIKKTPPALAENTKNTTYFTKSFF